ncbi:hypothetical protein [Paenibacillus sp. YYML68]|uniref:hypothetical protein n=1 Tax=Paenibacillus sp. YYML68 TaxID=2909250 RepID=UPI002492A8DD|nr:hypothetical protein [Paenibacillus sp. YYML68]
MSKSKDRELAFINAIRQNDLVQVFHRSIGSRVLVMTGPFPFLVIGEIKGTLSDFVLIQIETTHVTEMEGKTIRIHVESIETFYIEEEGKPLIPDIQEKPERD